MASLVGAGSATGTARATSTQAFELPGLRQPVALSHAAEAVQRAIELCARQGVSQARIELSPAELGTIRIHLQRTADGLTARVIAGHEAAQAFQQNADDLRRSLQSHGLTLLKLQIESDGGHGATHAHGRGEQPATASRRATGAAADSADTAADQPTTNSQPGALIDVLA